MFLDVKNVSKSYGDSNANLVLKDVNLTVGKGEICVIMGSSGSGKSTLLNLIGGLDTVDEGQIIIDGQEITGLTGDGLLEYRRSSLGFIFQFYNLIPNLTVSENVDVCRYLSETPLDKDELLKIVGLDKKKDQYPNTLSGGEQQRCAIVRALVKNPLLLLCDEPTGALDSKTALDILCQLERINKEYGTTILMVTHNEAISPMAHHIIRIQDGKIKEDYVNERKVRAKELRNI